MSAKAIARLTAELEAAKTRINELRSYLADAHKRIRSLEAQRELLLAAESARMNTTTDAATEQEGSRDGT